MIEFLNFCKKSYGSLKEIKEREDYTLQSM